MNKITTNTFVFPQFILEIVKDSKTGKHLYKIQLDYATQENYNKMSQKNKRLIDYVKT